MTTENQHRFLDLDAIVGDLDEDMDGTTDSDSHGGGGGGSGSGSDSGGGAGAGAASGDEGATALAAGYRRSFQIAPGQQVRVRQGPTTSAPVVRKLAGGAWVQVRCQRRGERVSGPYGTTDIWDNIGPGQYVSDAYVHTGSDGPVAPRCTS